MAVLSALTPMPSDSSATQSGFVHYDSVHTYVRTSTYDHGGRVRSIALPRDPDFDAAQSGNLRLGPTMGASMRFNPRGLPNRATAIIGTTNFDIVSNITYAR